jgi:beta-lactamase superfamily II metal-dependent hydrolase
VDGGVKSVRDACPDIQFTLEAVGEGLFYSGRMKNFNFVYDCGSQRKGAVDAAVDRYHKRIGTSTLDLLIISHLHSDHVNGLNKLLHLMKVKYIVLPYVPPIERLLIAAAAPRQEPWFYRFLTHPYRYLSKHGRIQRIVVVTSGRKRSKKRQGGENDNPNVEDTQRTTNFEQNLGDEFAINDESFKSMPEDREIQSQMEVDGELPAKRRSKVMVKQHFGYLDIGRNWMFRLFNNPISLSKFNSFVNCLKFIVGPLRGDLTVKELSNLLGDPVEIKRFAHCYKKVSSDLNFTSLVALHSPLRWKAISYIELERYSEVTGLHNLECVMCSQPSKEIGHLMLGDINLKSSWGKLQQHYKKYLGNIDAVLIPHHGSRQSWHKDLLNAIPSTCRMYLSVGIENQYNHPGIDVIFDVINSGRMIRWSNDFCEFSQCYYKIP